MKNDFLTMIEQADTIAITGHVRPDGDCVGSTVGLYNYIISNYDKQVQIYLEEFSKDFLFLHDADKISHTPTDQVYDLCIAVDCGDKERQGDFLPIFERAKRTMCVDHHISNPGFGEVCYVDAEACSAAEALYKLMEQDKINKNAAEALYMGIVHDTGVFKHSNTTKSAMSIAGDLIEKGANPSFIIDETFYKKTFVANKLLGIALTKAEQHADGRIISTVLETEDFRKSGAGKIDTDGIVDQLRLVFFHNVEFRMHVMLLHIIYLNRTECAKTYVKSYMGNIYALGFHLFQKFFGEMQTCCRSCCGTLILCLNSLVAILIL